MRINDGALLVMDVQQEIVERIGDSDLIGRLRRGIDIARAHEVPVIFIKVEFRSGYPEVGDSNLTFAQIRASGGLVGPSSRIHPAIAPQSGDIEVTKKRVSAFAGSDLDVLLRAREIRTLTLTGITTSGVVLSTLCAAADMDFRLNVLGDCCADIYPDVHQMLLEKVFPKRGDVLTIESWEERL